MTWRPAPERYALYRVARGGNVLRQLATGPDVESVTLALGRMLVEGNVEPDDRVGIHEAREADDGLPGRWVLNPYGKGGGG